MKPSHPARTPALGAVRVGLVGEVGAGSTAGVAGSAVLGLGLVLVVVEARGHLVVVAQGSVAARGAAQELLAVRLAVLAALVAAALGLAAADGEEPEEAGTDGKGDGDPGHGEEGVVDMALDPVELGRALDDADDSASHEGRGEGGTERYDSGEASDDPRQAGEDTRAVGKDAQDNLESQEKEGGDKGDLDPLVGGPVGLESRLDLIGELDLDAGSGTKVLDVGGVEDVRGPVELGLDALALALVGGVAVTPQADVVYLLEIEELGGDVCLDLVGAGLDVDVEVADDVVHVGRVDAQILDVNLEEVEVLVGDTGEGGDEEEDDGCDGECERHQYAKEATDAHCDVWLWLLFCDVLVGVGG